VTDGALAMLEAYHKCHPKLKTIIEMKEMLQSIWNSPPQELINIGKAVKDVHV